MNLAFRAARPHEPDRNEVSGNGRPREMVTTDSFGTESGLQAYFATSRGFRGIIKKCSDTAIPRGAHFGDF